MAQCNARCPNALLVSVTEGQLPPLGGGRLDGGGVWPNELTGADFLPAQAIASATTQPINVHPRKTFTTIMDPLLCNPLLRATIVGMKYGMSTTKSKTELAKSLLFITNQLPSSRTLEFGQGTAR